jgi:hypothetical protein
VVKRLLRKQLVEGPEEALALLKAVAEGEQSGRAAASSQ